MAVGVDVPDAGDAGGEVVRGGGGFGEGYVLFAEGGEGAGEVGVFDAVGGFGFDVGGVGLREVAIGVCGAAV